MANRNRFFYRQKVTEAELNKPFGYLEDADHEASYDRGLSGICFGFGVSEHSPLPNLSVDVDGPGVAYDALGQRIRFASLQVCDVSVDHDGNSTAVVNPGNEKFVSVFLKFKRELSDPRTDGHGSTVYFEESESWEFYVTQGAEAPPTAPRPALEADGILLCDVLLQFGDTAVNTVDLFLDRRQDAFVIELLGRYPALWHVGQLKDVLDALALISDLHVSGMFLNHHDEDIYAAAYAGVLVNLTDGTVESQLHELLDYLDAFGAAYLPLAGGTMSGDILTTGGSKLGDGVDNWEVHATTVDADDTIVAGSYLKSNNLSEAATADLVGAVVRRNQCVAWARVTGAGVLLAPHWNVLSVSRLSAGRYAVTLDVGPATHIGVLVEPEGVAAGGSDNAHFVVPGTTTTFEVSISEPGGTPADIPFFFVVFGY
jgi:hypothetical protein